MTDVVGVVFVEVVRGHYFSELVLEEEEGLLHGQAGALKEQAVLAATVVFQFVVLVTAAREASVC